MKTEEAIALYETKWWLNKTPQEIVAFQLYEPLLCMPFGDYHKAVEDALERPVWTHEFAMPDILKAEFEKRIPKGTVANSMAMLHNLVGKDKPIIKIVS